MQPKEMASEDVGQVLELLELRLRMWPIRMRLEESFPFAGFLSPLLLLYKSHVSPLFQSLHSGVTFGRTFTHPSQNYIIP